LSCNTVGSVGLGGPHSRAVTPLCQRATEALDGIVLRALKEQH
jgi:hypothetical protein